MARASPIRQARLATDALRRPYGHGRQIEHVAGVRLLQQVVSQPISHSTHAVDPMGIMYLIRERLRDRSFARPTPVPHPPCRYQEVIPSNSASLVFILSRRASYHSMKPTMLSGTSPRSASPTRAARSELLRPASHAVGLFAAFSRLSVFVRNWRFATRSRRSRIACRSAGSRSNLRIFGIVKSL